MARHEVSLRVNLRLVSLLATCTVCDALLVVVREFPDVDEKMLEAQCRCGESLDLHLPSLHVEADCVPDPCPGNDGA